MQSRTFDVNITLGVVGTVVPHPSVECIAQGGQESLSEHRAPASFLLSLPAVGQPLALKSMAASQRLTVSVSFPQLGSAMLPLQLLTAALEGR